MHADDKAFHRQDAEGKAACYNLAAYMPPPTSDVITLWYHYEEIAMHFNGLIIQFRLQLIGGAGALGAAAAVIGSKVAVERERRSLRSFAASGLLILIAAAASLDLFYYRRLLGGAVVALLEFERNHPEIDMSTRIEEAVGLGRHAVWFAYTLILLTLFIFCVWSWCDVYRHRHDPQPPRAGSG